MLDEKVVHEIAVRLENGAIDEPTLVGVQPQAGAIPSELAAIFVRVHQIDPPLVSLAYRITGQ